MNAMKVNKATLKLILGKNRDNHRGLFLKAQKVYRELVINELDKMLKDAKDGASIRRRINFSAPEDHTAEYDKLIGLLDLSLEDKVDLTLGEYDAYVNDNWAWSRIANTKNSAYASNNISPMFVGEDAHMPSSY